MRRILTLIPIALLLAAALAACGAGDNRSDVEAMPFGQSAGFSEREETISEAEKMAATAAADFEAPSEAPIEAFAEEQAEEAAFEEPMSSADADFAQAEAMVAEAAMAAPAAAMAEAAPGSDGGGVPALQTAERRVISTGFMSVAVEDVPAAAARVRQAAEALGGFVENSNVSGAGAEASAQVTIRVPQAVFPDALDRIRRIGDVQSEELHAQDVTEQFIDLAARLRSAERTEARLLALLDRAEFVQDVIAIEWELGRIRTEIERFQGQLNHLERRVALSTLSVSLFAPFAVRTEPPSAAVHLDASDVEAAVAAIEGIAASAEGLVDAAEVTSDADAASGYALIRVPRGAFARAVRDVEAVGDVRAKTIRAGAGAEDPVAPDAEPDAFIEVWLATPSPLRTEPPSALLDLDTGDVDNAIEMVEREAAAAEGLVDVAEITIAEEVTSGYVVIRVPRDAFAGVVRAIEAAGDVRGKTIRTGEGADDPGAAFGAEPDALVEVWLHEAAGAPDVGLIAGIAVAAGLGVIVVLIVAVYGVRRRRRGPVAGDGA